MEEDTSHLLPAFYIHVCTCTYTSIHKENLTFKKAISVFSDNQLPCLLGYGFVNILKKKTVSLDPSHTISTNKQKLSLDFRGFIDEEP